MDSLDLPLVEPDTAIHTALNRMKLAESNAVVLHRANVWELLYVRQLLEGRDKGLSTVSEVEGGAPVVDSRHLGVLPPNWITPIAKEPPPPPTPSSSVLLPGNMPWQPLLPGPQRYSRTVRSCRASRGVSLMRKSTFPSSTPKPGLKMRSNTCGPSNALEWFWNSRMVAGCSMRSYCKSPAIAECAWSGKCRGAGRFTLSKRGNERAGSIRCARTNLALSLAVIPRSEFSLPSIPKASG